MSVQRLRLGDASQIASGVHHRWVTWLQVKSWSVWISCSEQVESKRERWGRAAAGPVCSEPAQPTSHVARVLDLAQLQPVHTSRWVQPTLGSAAGELESRTRRMLPKSEMKKCDRRHFNWPPRELMKIPRPAAAPPPAQGCTCSRSQMKSRTANRRSTDAPASPPGTRRNMLLAAARPPSTARSL